MKITLRPIEHAFVPAGKYTSPAIKGVIMQVQEIKLVRKVAFLYFYEVVKESLYFKPVLGVLSASCEEDVTYKGHYRLWLKINAIFDNFDAFQHSLRIEKVVSHNTTEYWLLNHFLLK